MKQLMKFRYSILKSLPIILSGLVVAWCSFYLLFGASSIFSLRVLKVQQASLEQTAAKLVTKRETLEDRVKRMRPGSIDWDLVEQEAQTKLGAPMDQTKSLKM
jgi:cell division protein FtsB